VAKYPLDKPVGGLERTLGEELLEPTKIYARQVYRSMSSGQIHAMAHITGGGLTGNVPRVLPDGIGVLLDPRKWPRPEIFNVIQRAGDVEEAEMRRTFNLGIGMALVVAAAGADTVLREFRGAGFGAAIVGEVVPSDADGDARVRFVGD
jgi:phosphoribosylformylglycinamidine cyclo-ligase